MEIDKLARKLEPLMPEQIQKWLRARDTVNGDLKGLIEKQIVHTAYRVLGDYRKKILLSLPSKKQASGRVHLGNVIYEKEKWAAGISESELLQNLAIFGRSGAGKTNVAFRLLKQLTENKVPWVFLDWKRTARHLLPHLRTRINIYTPGRSVSPFVFNPFIPPPGVEHHLYINQLVDVMASAFTLGDGARSILQKAISSCYKIEGCPTITDILEAVEKQEAKSRAHGWKMSALRALETLQFSHITGNQEVEQEQIVQSLLQGQTVIELNGLNQGAKNFLIPLLCLWLYYYQLGQRERETLNLVIFVEEAHHVFYGQGRGSGESIMEMLLRQCRELGIAMIIIDQHPHLISPAALGNTYTTVCLNLKDPSDINKAAKLCLLEEDEKKFFSMLPVGQGIVKLQNRWHKPFLVQFPLMNIEKGSISNGDLQAYMRLSQTGSGRRRLQTQGFKQVRQVRLQDNMVLNDDELAFLEDVTQHRDDGVKARYKRLGWSVDKGNRVKQELVAQGWLDSEVVSVGQSRKVLLRLSSAVRGELGFDADAPPREGLAHEYWKRWYAKLFQDRGYRVSIEAPRVGGRVDVLAVKNGEQIGIEVETGKSTFVQNVKNCLASGFSRVIVVATSRAALRKVDRELVRAGLLVPTRVTLVLQGEFAFDSHI